MQDSEQEPSSTRSRGLAAVVLSSLILGGVSGCSGTGGQGASAGTKRKVLIVAADGLTWQVLRPLLAAGEMPNLAQMVASGASGELATTVPTLSPVIWTTIATGKSADKHGIRGFWHKAPAGAQGRTPAEQAHIDQLKSLGYIGGGPDSAQSDETMILYDRSFRRAKALWNILSERGMTSDVFGWWVTYPAEPIRGRMVSDRYLYSHIALKAEAETWLVYERDGDLVHPPELETRLRPLVLEARDVTTREMAEFVGGPVTPPGRLRLHAVEDELRVAYAKDTSLFRMAKMSLAERIPDLLAVYVQGADIAGHYFWKYRFPDEWAARFPGAPVVPDERRRYGGTIDAYYRFLDRRIGEIWKLADEATAVLVCSDHGFHAGRRAAAQSVSGEHTDAPPGVILLSGSGIRKGVRLEGAHVHDIAPTVLALLGLPVADDMDGRPLTDALDESAHEVRRIQSYETKPMSPPADQSR